MTIIISQNGTNAVKVDKSTFDKEDHLQKYIYDNPESIPLYDIKENIRLLILAREFPTNSGPIDAIGVDQYGELYIVETKLYKNPDKRTVISQALDYGAALWKHADDFAEFQLVLDRHTQKVFNQSSAEKVAEFFSLEDEEVAVLFEKAKENLNDGKFRFVVLMDKLDDRLKDLILYVNQNSQFDIYAVEFSYYKHEQHEIIIPRIFGAEVKKDINVEKTSGARKVKKWNEEEILATAKTSLDIETYNAVTSLLTFSKGIGDSLSIGSGVTAGSFGPIVNKISVRSFFTVRTDGILKLNFQWMDGSDASEQFKDQYFDAMKEIFTLSQEDKEKFPRVTPDEWVPVIDDFQARIKGVIDSV